MALLEHQQEVHQSQLLPKVAEKPASLAEKDVADRLVYKLVRVEEDGTVVPATEDEVIQMESLLVGDTGTNNSKVETSRKDQELVVCEHEENYVSRDKASVDSQHVDGVEAERKKLLAQLQFLDVILQKLKDEEQQRTSSEGLDSVAGCAELTEGSGEHASQPMCAYLDLDCKWECKSDVNILSPDISDDAGRKFVGAGEQLNYSKVSLGDLESPLSTSKHSWINTPSESTIRTKTKQRNISDDRTSRGWDCDLFQGNVCLDNLSIRELHEAFRTTFGRQTSVKDKQWLKRRISMGLKSFHEVANDNVVVEAEAIVSNASAKDVHTWVRPGSNSPAEQPLHMPGTVQAYGNRISETSISDLGEPKSLDHKKRSPRGMHPSNIVGADGLPGNSENAESKEQVQLIGDREGKRQRKPTKRYIEELAVTDTRDVIGKSTVKDSTPENLEMVLFDKTRLDDRGEHAGTSHALVSGMKFRTGYRGHRGRPKKNGNLALACKSAGRAAQLVRKAISVQASRLSAKVGAVHSGLKLAPCDDKMDSCVRVSKGAPQSSSPLASNMELVAVPSDLNSSEANVEIVPTPKGGMRRKHHRPWTIREVMKLVEGVSQCGVGKWAEIKKLAFSNSVYRTSVDLKDKWRNLLRASDTHLQAIRQGEHRRKHASAPIPGQILIQVRELAAQQSQPVCVNLDCGISRSGRTVHRRHFI